MAAKKANSQRNTKHEYLLKNLLFCGECGKRYYCDSKRSRRIYCCSVKRYRGGVGRLTRAQLLSQLASVPGKP